MDIKHPNLAVVPRKVLDAFGLAQDLYFLTKWLHYEAGILLIVKNAESLAFIRKWRDFFENRFEDTVYSGFLDVSGQYRGYAHNGGDQAVFQCMLYGRIRDFWSILDNLYYRHGVYARKAENGYLEKLFRGRK